MYTTPLHKQLRLEDPLSPLVLNLTMEYARRKIYLKIIHNTAARAKIVLDFPDYVDAVAQTTIKDIFTQFEEAALGEPEIQ